MIIPQPRGLANIGVNTFSTLSLTLPLPSKSASRSTEFRSTPVQPSGASTFPASNIPAITSGVTSPALPSITSPLPSSSSTASSSASSPEVSTTSQKSFPTGVVIGVAVGGVLLLLFLGCITYVLVSRLKRRKQVATDFVPVSHASFVVGGQESQIFSTREKPVIQKLPHVRRPTLDIETTAHHIGALGPRPHTPSEYTESPYNKSPAHSSPGGGFATSPMTDPFRNAGTVPYRFPPVSMQSVATMSDTTTPASRSTHGASDFATERREIIRGGPMKEARGARTNNGAREGFNDLLALLDDGPPEFGPPRRKRPPVRRMSEDSL